MSILAHAPAAATPALNLSDLITPDDCCADLPWCVGDCQAAYDLQMHYTATRRIGDVAVYGYVQDTDGVVDRYVYVGREEFTSADARALAALLVQLADQVEKAATA